MHVWGPKVSRPIAKILYYILVLKQILKYLDIHSLIWYLNVFVVIDYRSMFAHAQKQTCAIIKWRWEIFLLQVTGFLGL